MIPLISTQCAYVFALVTIYLRWDTVFLQALFNTKYVIMTSMQHHSSQKRQLIVRFLVYGLMTTSVVVIVSILMLVILGYSFNRTDGRIEQGGLLQFATTPSGARVTLDEAALPARTPTKSSVSASSHAVKMELADYRAWHKTANVRAGSIVWLSYARLIPNEVKTESLRDFPTLTGALASSDRKWMLLQTEAGSSSMLLANLQNKAVEYTTLTLPNDILTAAASEAPSTISLETWSGDNRFALLKRTYDTSKVEWLILDRADPTKSVNVTTSFGVNASKVIFGDNNGRTLFIRTDDIVRKVNLDDQTLSRPLVTNVDDFSVFKDETVVYSTKLDATEKRHVGYVREDMKAPQTIETYDNDGLQLRMAFGEYYGVRYVAIVHGTSLDIVKGTLPHDADKGELTVVSKQTVPGDVQKLGITRNGRFVVAQSPDSHLVYDIELRRADETKFTKPATAARELHWLDDYVLWSDRGDMLRFLEFDGANQQDIMPVAEGFSVTLSSDNKYVYGIVRTDKGFALSRGTLILN